MPTNLLGFSSAPPRPVWPDVEIESSPNFYKGAQIEAIVINVAFYVK